MDRVKKYRKVVKEVLEKHIGFPSRDFPNLQDVLVVDSQEQHFLFLTIGWEKAEYVHDTVYHFEIKDNGELWIHQCNSTAEIDLELIDRGVNETDIKVSILEFDKIKELSNPPQTELQEQRA